jgi:hypothetical protein
MRGPASLETEAVFVGKKLKELRSLGEENDSSSRQLARYIAEISRIYGTDVSPLLIFRPDRYLRGGDHTLSTNMASQPSDLPNSAKITTTSIRTCAPKMASNTAICPSSSISITLPMWPD